MTAITNAPPWLALSAEISDLLRPHLAELTTEIIAAIPGDVPSYARPLEGRFGDGVRQGVGVALSRFLDLPGTAQSALTPGSRQVYAALGRGEMRQGRSLESLLAAYRSGARVTFRAVSGIAEANGLPTSILVALGESIFAYIDELSAASVEGYAMEQSERAGERDRRRDEVLQLLVRGQADEAALRRAAAAAGWTMPDELMAVTMPLERTDGLRIALGRDALVMARTTDAVAILAVPLGAKGRRDLDRALAARRAVIGPARSWQRVAESLRLATLASAMPLASSGAGSRAVKDAPPLWVEDHLAAVALGSEPQAVTDLARIRLAPLDSLRPAQRERLAETLLSWLRHRGQRGPVARELSIHPQTVGYRVGQLRELFGDDLEDPEARFELELVLRAGHH